MLLAFETAICAALSWYVALCFIRFPAARIAVFSACAAVLCFICELLTPSVVPKWLSPFDEYFIFLILAFIICTQNIGNPGDIVLAFFLGVSQIAFLRRIISAWLAVSGNRGLIVAGVVILCHAGLTLLLKGRFPQTDWREYFGPEQINPDRLPINKWQVYFIAILSGTFLPICSFVAPICNSAQAVMFSIGALLLFWSSILLLILMHAYKRERLYMLAERQYRDETRSFMNVIRSQRHDYNFHVQTITSLIHRGDIEECRRYVDALEKDTGEMNDVLPIRDPAISAAIHNFRLLAAREGIILHVDIRNDLSQISTGAYETNKIIGNLLQNAIDEMKSHKDKSEGILLSIFKRNEFCIIRVSNALEGTAPTADEIGRFYRQGYSTKKGHEGVGLSSVSILVRRYGGSLETQLDDNRIHFIARVPINAAKRICDENGDVNEWN